MPFHPIATSAVGAAGAASAATQAATLPATQPAGGQDLLISIVVLLAGLALSLGVAAAVGVFKPGRVDGPLRVGPDRPLWPLAVALGMGLFVLFGTSTLYFSAKQVHDHAMQKADKAGAARPPEAASRPATAGGMELTLRDNVFLSTVPGLLAFGSLVLADRWLSGPLQLRLGFTARRFPDGVAKGLLGLVIVMPLMFVGETILELLYRATDYHHPGEHALLKLMGEAPSPLLRWLLIGGALVTAPFFEEYVFRGLLQTLLRETFIRWSARGRRESLENQSGGPDPRGFPPALPAPESSRDAPAPPSVRVFPLAAPPDAAAEADPVPPPGKRVWQTWAAILITSLAFALIHETWTAPLIFLLAICLGYAYERTGSLWTSITIHFLFNAISTALYLKQAL